MNLLINIDYPSGKINNKEIMYSFRIDKKPINKAKKEAKKLVLCPLRL